MKNILARLLSLTVFLSLATPAFAVPIEELPTSPEPVFEDVALLQERVLERWREVQDSWRPVPAERIGKLLQSASDILKGGYAQDAEKIRQANSMLVEAQVLMMPSRAVEFRGALLDADLIGIDPVALGQLLDKLKAAGFNAVLPEIFRRGYALFPNRVAEVDPLYAKRGIDALKMVSEAAKARGLMVYPWLWTFRVFSPSTSTANPVADRLPALISPQINRQSVSDANGEGLEDESLAFVSPASPEWRQLMGVLVGDIARGYDVQGFLLDYIRYGNNATNDQLSQTGFNMDYFRRVGNFPPRPIDPGSDLYAEWHLWREEQVHRMVQQVRLSAAEVRPGLSLGTAVFRNEANARNSKMQNWRHWANNNWIDFVAPMLYANNRQQLDLWLDWESDWGSRRDMLYPILGLQTLRTSGALFDQLALLQERHVPGSSLFAVRRLDARTLDWLQQGPFRRPAEAPHANPLSSVRRQLLAIAEALEGLAKPPEKPDPRLSARPLPAGADPSALISALRSRAANLDQSALTTQIEALAEQVSNSSLPDGLRRDLGEELAYASSLAGILAEHAPGNRSLRPPSKPPSAVLAEARPLPQIQIPLLAQAPAIDGRLDDPAWQGASRIPGLWWSTGSARAQVGTRVQLGYDAQGLYIGYANDEPRPDRLRSTWRTDNEQLASSGDDTVEVFLSPGNQPQKYYYFVLSPGNTRFAKASFDASWQGGWEGRSSRSDKGWQAELGIPFSSLRVPAPLKGGDWRANFCRRRPQEIVPYHCWSFTFGGVHRTDRFGSLRFEAQPAPSPSPSAE